MARSPYWINGKAGSGKSTLMRFIYCSPCTQQALHGKFGAGDGFILGWSILGRGVTVLREGHPPQDSPITSGYCYTSGGNYCAPGCRLLSSSDQPYISAASPAASA